MAQDRELEDICSKCGTPIRDWMKHNAHCDGTAWRK